MYGCCGRVDVLLLRALKFRLVPFAGRQDRGCDRCEDLDARVAAEGAPAVGRPWASHRRGVCSGMPPGKVISPPLETSMLKSGPPGCDKAPISPVGISKKRVVRVENDHTVAQAGAENLQSARA
jgi:hypothetical protein